MKVSRNWLTHVHQWVLGYGGRWISIHSLKSTRCRIGSQWRTSRIVDEMLSNLRLRAISLAAALSTLQLPQVDVGRSNQNAIAIVEPTWIRALTNAMMVSDVKVPLTERSCLIQKKQRHARLLMWSANVSSWSITPGQVTERSRSTARPLTTKTEASTLASWYDVTRQVNCVFPVFNFSLFEVSQTAISLMHDVRRPNTTRHLSKVGFILYRLWWFGRLTSCSNFIVAWCQAQCYFSYDFLVIVIVIVIHFLSF